MVMPFDNIVLRNFTNISDNYLVFAKSKNNCSSCPVFYAYKQVVMSEGNACDPTFINV